MENTPAPPTPAEWGIVGWNPFEAGSIRWLAADHWSLTRDDRRAARWPTYQEADAVAVATGREMPSSISRWRPAKIGTPLDQLQEHVRRPRPTVPNPNPNR